MTLTARTPRSGHRTYHDAPDTDADFAELARLPQGPARQALHNCVVAAWLPMAHRLARTFRNRGESLEDLEQVAALALVKAVERYDPRQGHAFQTFAIPTIQGELKRHFRDNMWHLHVPRRIQTLRNRVRRTLRELEVTTTGHPTTRQIAHHAGLDEDEVRAGMEALHSFTTLSLDAPTNPTPTGAGERDVLLADTLGTHEPGYDLTLDREAARVYLRCLPARERHILYLRFFHEMPQHQIAELIGISQMHVSRLITTTCNHLRNAIETDSRTSRQTGGAARVPRDEDHAGRADGGPGRR